MPKTVMQSIERLKRLRQHHGLNFVPHQLKLVEVELLDPIPNILRANKSLLTRRIISGELKAKNGEILADAGEYWAGRTHSAFDEEVLFAGRYRYTRIISEPAPHCRSSLIDLDDEHAAAA